MSSSYCFKIYIHEEIIQSSQYVSIMYIIICFFYIKQHQPSCWPLDEWYEITSYQSFIIWFNYVYIIDCKFRNVELSVQTTQFTDYFDVVFDAAWSLFLALHDTELQLKRVNSSLEDFTYEREDISKMIYNNILKQKFIGQSVCSYFSVIVYKYLLLLNLFYVILYTNKSS